MSLVVKHEADGSVTVECGGAKVTFQLDGVPVTTTYPLRVKRLIGKGAGHTALDIRRIGEGALDEDLRGELISLPLDASFDLDAVDDSTTSLPAYHIEDELKR